MKAIAVDDELYMLENLEEAILAGADIAADPVLAKHDDWVQELKAEYCFTHENMSEILRKEVGKVFAKVLEHAGVYKRTEDGKAAFVRFVDCVNQQA